MKLHTSPQSTTLTLLELSDLSRWLIKIDFPNSHMIKFWLGGIQEPKTLLKINKKNKEITTRFLEPLNVCTTTNGGQFDADLKARLKTLERQENAL